MKGNFLAQSEPLTAGALNRRSLQQLEPPTARASNWQNLEQPGHRTATALNSRNLEQPEPPTFGPLNSRSLEQSEPWTDGAFNSWSLRVWLYRSYWGDWLLVIYRWWRLLSQLLPTLMALVGKIICLASLMKSLNHNFGSILSGMVSSLPTGQTSNSNSSAKCNNNHLLIQVRL